MVVANEILVTAWTWDLDSGLSIIGDFLETFDNADPTITYDALKLILNTKESFPSFDLEGFSMR